MTWARTGFEKLKQAFGRTDFHVMAGRTSEGLRTTWSFGDIVGTLEYLENSEKASIAIDPMPLPTSLRRDDMAIDAYNNLWAAAFEKAKPWGGFETIGEFD